MLDTWRMRAAAWRDRRAGRAYEREERYADRRRGLVPSRTCYREARATYVGDDMLLCWVQGRYFLYVSSRDINVTPALATFGRVAPWVSRVIAESAKPGMTVADVGANVGYFTMLLADRVGRGGRVHAFEPNTDLSALIQRSAEANQLDGRVTVHPVALGAREGGEAWLCLSGRALAGAALHDAAWASRWTAPSDADAGIRAPREARAVTLARLDALPDAGAIAFAKIDVEGFEPEVWAGMDGVLAGETLRRVVLEYTPGHYDDAAAFRERLFRPGWSVSLIDGRDGPAAITRDALAALDPQSTYDLLLAR